MNNRLIFCAIISLGYAVASGVAPKQPSALKKIEAGVQKKWLKIKAKWAEAKKSEIESRAEFDARRKKGMVADLAETAKEAVAEASTVAEKELTVRLGKFNGETKTFPVFVKVPLYDLSYQEKVSFAGMELDTIRGKWGAMEKAAANDELIGRVFFDLYRRGDTFLLTPYKLAVGIKGEDALFTADIFVRKGRYVAGVKPINMILVKGGTFKMGSSNGESDEKPVHTVELSSFYIGRTEVTQAQWQQVMGDNPSSFKGTDARWSKCPGLTALNFAIN